MIYHIILSPSPKFSLFIVSNIMQDKKIKKKEESGKVVSGCFKRIECYFLQNVQTHYLLIPSQCVLQVDFKFASIPIYALFHARCYLCYQGKEGDYSWQVFIFLYQKIFNPKTNQMGKINHRPLGSKHNHTRKLNYFENYFLDTSETPRHW